MGWFRDWTRWREARRQAIQRYYDDQVRAMNAVRPAPDGNGQQDNPAAISSQRPEDPRWSALTALFGSAIVTVGVLAALVWLLIRLSEKVDGQEAALSLVFVSAAVILILVVCTLTIVLKRLRLTDVAEPMGLPRGSIRAVIALLLILLFFIAAIFMFSQTRELGGDRSQNRVIKHMSAATYAAIPVDQIATATPITKKGVTTYDVVLYPQTSGTPTSDDLAKQIVTTVATLVTAVAAFYFGANVVSSAHKDAGASGGGGGGGQPRNPAGGPGAPAADHRNVTAEETGAAAGAPKGRGDPAAADHPRARRTGTSP
jgi:hypothetical protein